MTNKANKTTPAKIHGKKKSFALNLRIKIYIRVSKSLMRCALSIVTYNSFDVVATLVTPVVAVVVGVLTTLVVAVVVTAVVIATVITLVLLML